MSFISASPEGDAPAADAPAPAPLVYALEGDAETVLGRVIATTGEANTARQEATDFLKALERAHLRVAEQLGINSPFKPAPVAPPAAPPVTG